MFSSSQWANGIKSGFLTIGATRKIYHQHSYNLGSRVSHRESSSITHFTYSGKQNIEAVVDSQRNPRQVYNCCHERTSHIEPITRAAIYAALEPTSHFVLVEKTPVLTARIRHKNASRKLSPSFCVHWHRSRRTGSTPRKGDAEVFSEPTCVKFAFGFIMMEILVSRQT